MKSGESTLSRRFKRKFFIFLAVIAVVSYFTGYKISSDRLRERASAEKKISQVFYNYAGILEKKN